MKTSHLLTALFTFMSGMVYAQELSSYHYLEVQGGLQCTATNAPFTKLLSPTYGLSYGYMTPALGGRLHINGLQSKGRYESLDQNYKWKYCTFDADILLNISNLLSKDYNHLVNAMLVGGFGLTNTWSHEADDDMAVRHNLMHNLRVGARFETNITKPLGLSLEIDANNLSDNFNGKRSSSSDWAFTAMIGVSYRFGKKYAKPSLILTDKRTPSVADTKPTNYQMMTNRLNAEMEIWARQMPEETLEDYQMRVNETTRAAQAKMLEYKISTEMATEQLPAQALTIGMYNPTLKKLAVRVGNMPDIYLDMEQSEVSELYKKNLQLKNAKYDVKEDNTFEIVSAEVYNPATGKTYVFNNMNSESLDYIKEDANFLALETVHETNMQEIALEKLNNEILDKAKNSNVISDKTHITVSSKAETAKDEKGNSIVNLNVGFSYDVEESFSARDDFKPGHYHIEESKAALLMLDVMKKAFETDYAKYLAEGKKVKIIITGSADASPINGTIHYDGKYGEYNNQKVTKNGVENAVSLTKADGITINEQLAFARALGVQKYMQKNIPALKRANQDADYAIKVSQSTGSQYRRISVQCVFIDVF